MVKGLDEIRTEFLEVCQPFVYTPPQLRPLRKLVLCTCFEELGFSIKEVRFHLTLPCSGR